MRRRDLRRLEKFGEPLWYGADLVGWTVGGQSRHWTYRHITEFDNVKVIGGVIRVHRDSVARWIEEHSAPYIPKPRAKPKEAASA